MRPSPPASRSRRTGLRAALVATIAGTFIGGLIPAAAADTMHTAHGGRAGTVMADTADTVMAGEGAATPSASMSPHAPSPVQAGPQLAAILKSLICRCGCNLTVYDCEGTMTCDVSAKMRADAERMLGRGLSKDQILEAFAADYGEQVLAAPTKKGFNLTAWVLPFAVLALGGLVVAFALRSWRPASTTQAEPPQVDQKYVEEVEKELKREV